MTRSAGNLDPRLAQPETRVFNGRFRRERILTFDQYPDKYTARKPAPASGAGRLPKQLTGCFGGRGGVEVAAD